MSILNLISLLSGLALFLYGISLMGDGLSLVAGNKRVGDQCSNIAAAMIEPAHDVFDTHEYPDSLKIIKDEAFATSYGEFRAKYML